MPKVKNQHFVPRLYLRQFEGLNNRVWVYDKSDKKVFNVQVDKIAGERYFYDSSSLDQKKGKEQYLENLYSSIETEFAPKYKDFITEIILDENKVISVSEKEFLSNYIVTQIDRTKEHREESKQSYFHLTEQLKEMGFSKNQLETMGFTEEFEAKDLHLESITTGLENKSMFSNLLMEHIWLIFKNETSLSFYTSDNPIVKHAHIKNNDGFISPGIEIAFPLTPNYILVMCEREYFKTFEKNENKQLKTQNLDNIKYYNSLQVVNCYRQIYSENNDFNLINELWKKNPNVFSPDRKRF